MRPLSRKQHFRRTVRRSSLQHPNNPARLPTAEPKAPAGADKVHTFPGRRWPDQAAASRGTMSFDVPGPMMLPWPPAVLPGCDDDCSYTATRSVRFNSRVNAVLIPALADMQEAEKMKIWWGPYDYVAFRTSFLHELQSAEKVSEPMIIPGTTAAAVTTCGGGDFGDFTRDEEAALAA